MFHAAALRVCKYSNFKVHSENKWMPTYGDSHDDLSGTNAWTGIYHFLVEILYWLDWGDVQFEPLKNDMWLFLGKNSALAHAIFTCRRRYIWKESPFSCRSFFALWAHLLPIFQAMNHETETKFVCSVTSKCNSFFLTFKTHFFDNGKQLLKYR